MKKLLAILLSFILVIGTVIGVNAVVYYYGAGGPDMTLNFYIDSSKVPTTTFTEIEMKIFSSFNTYADMIKLYDKWSFLGNVKVESSLEGAELYTGYTEKQGAVTFFKFKSEEGFEIAENQPFLSITNVNADLYTSNDSIDYIVDKLVGSDGTDYADKDAVTTDLKIPEGTYYTHPCEGALYVNNLNITTPTVNNIDFGFEPYKIAELKDDGYSLWYCHQPVPPWMEMFYYQYGKYIFVNQFGQGENCHGFYIQKDNKQLMLSQAFEEGITDIDEVVSLIMSADIPNFNKSHIVDTSQVQGNWENLFPEFHINHNETTEPSTAATEPSSETQTTEPTTEPPTEKPTTPAKAANPMKVTVKTKVVKYAKVKKSAQTVAPITVKKAAGKVTYKKLSGSNKLALKSNGKIVVKKGTKKGTYTAKIKVNAKGNSKFKSASKTVKVKIVVK